jgi:uncharacterized SAM-binding protein YcdF (DUF218 family)
VGFALLLTRWKPAGRRILVVSLALFLIGGLLPIGAVLLGALEDRFPAWPDTGSPPDGIVVLGGPIRLRMSELRGSIEFTDGAERFTVVPSLARRFPNARIVFTGGNGSLSGGLSEAPFAIQLLESFGIPRERLVVEDRARNTAENASFTKVLVKPKPGERWLLVTSAAHMPRAVGAFRKVDFPVEPHPVDWQTAGGQRSWRPWLLPIGSPVGGWRTIDDAAKEWIGLVTYWLAGYSSELFPAPQLPADKRP